MIVLTVSKSLSTKRDGVMSTVDKDCPLIYSKKWQDKVPNVRTLFDEKYNTLPLVFLYTSKDNKTEFKYFGIKKENKSNNKEETKFDFKDKIYISKTNPNNKSIISIFKSPKDVVYSSCDYYYNKDHFIIMLFNNKINKFEFFEFKNSKLNKISEDKFKQLDLTMVNLPDMESYKSIVKENDKLKSDLSGAVKIQDNIYILAIETDFWSEHLLLFDALNKKIVPIDMGNVFVVQEYTDTSMYYDEKLNTLFFTGYKTEKNYINHFDKGIYSYNFKIKQVSFLYRTNNDESYAICPYRIPDTDYLIFMDDKLSKGIDQIYIKKI
jgi:hypothetical protein